MAENFRGFVGAGVDVDVGMGRLRRPCAPGMYHIPEPRAGQAPQPRIIIHPRPYDSCTRRLIVTT